MQIIPAIDILAGRCVRLYQGDYSQETVFAEDPVEVALHWERLGAERLHVVDLDGARSGRPANREAVRDIIAAVHIPVQTGGGIRTAQDVREYIRSGAARVVIGTSAVQDPRMVGEATQQFPEGIVVSIDARNGVVTTEGWTQTTRERADWFIDHMVEWGVRRFIYTDVTRDGTLTEPNYEAIEALLRKVDVPIIAAGGIARLEHLARLADLGVEAAIVGRALYTGDIDLVRALDAMRAQSA
ncbi:MAG TPA: 1-(5-phosphoribosyl)-5-[(5-phosphoribosylamino)methylideneamino]imidazole-4-carboxamide isomerase [Dehalococcoidia bacterium]|nr:1-(5-phosphoribosyl)-5-[(5-phosphoribosylamino)methylideneamino]imidazole-4-carboxamide isomerase [Dehalococcoidia bacterium]